MYYIFYFLDLDPLITQKESIIIDIALSQEIWYSQKYGL